MNRYLVRGGKPLFGVVPVHGAKNSILPILAATLLGRGVSVLHNCPDLADVSSSLAILSHLGCKVKREKDVVTVDAGALTRSDVPDHLMREMRSSVIFLGGIIARLGEATISYPGGCELGPRPVDIHLASLRNLGAVISETGGLLACSGDKMQGTIINLALPSVGATENTMLAACAAQGVTTICNAAREPEIVDLQGFLRSMGARVQGAGSSVITVQGGIPLHGGDYFVMSDRIVAATYLCAVASAGGEVELQGVDYRNISTVSAILAEAGCHIRSCAQCVCIRKDECPLRGIAPIRTAPYPGFPTDAQAPVMAVLAKSRGTTVFVENIFTSRYRHVDELKRCGADINVEGRVAVVCGVPSLHGASLVSTDLRGGAALVVAALGAEGRSEISGINHIERGYEALDRTLASLGADIKKAEG